jgi:hypothetical protein
MLIPLQNSFRMSFTVRGVLESLSEKEEFEHGKRFEEDNPLFMA